MPASPTPISPTSPAMCCCSVRSPPDWMPRCSPIHTSPRRCASRYCPGADSNAAAIAAYEAWRQHGFGGGV
ncbi:Uncharacterised protein [Mycobacteroides abscessus subsp. abscessus]|nr:Uncharacterised protein [Mycobacteroides abscessus subsp. abscessus]